MYRMLNVVAVFEEAVKITGELPHIDIPSSGGWHILRSGTKDGFNVDVA